MPAALNPAPSPEINQNPINPGGPLRNGNPRGNPNAAPRCGARNRAGCPCRAPALRGKLRCRLHGGHSTGPRTEQGRARIRAARTIHGRYAAAAQVEERHARGIVRRIHLLCEAVRLRPWLDPAPRARLESGAAVELGAPPDPGWRTTPWTVQAAREAARAEAAALLPWRAAIAAAKAAKRAAREAGASGETARTAHEPWPVAGTRARNGHPPGAGDRAPPDPVAPSPVAPNPVAPNPVAPSPVAPSPVAPSPVAPSPVAPSPVAPSPVAPSPVIASEAKQSPARRRTTERATARGRLLRRCAPRNDTGGPRADGAAGRRAGGSPKEPMNRATARWRTGFKGRLCGCTCLTVRGVIGESTTLAWPSDLLGPLPPPGQSWTDALVAFLRDPQSSHEP
jgi:hypothetical protein